MSNRTKFWLGRGRTLRAALYLCAARAAIVTIPFRWWRRTLESGHLKSSPRIGDARAIVSTVERACQRLPFEMKCLPRAMALSWLLRRNRIAHDVVIAARQPSSKQRADNLHAWVEVEGVKVIGDLPGRWAETLRLRN